MNFVIEHILFLPISQVGTLFCYLQKSKSKPKSLPIIFSQLNFIQKFIVYKVKVCIFCKSHLKMTFLSNLHLWRDKPGKKKVAKWNPLPI